MPEPPFKVRAVFEYSSPHEDDLNFPNGQVITVTEEEDNDWFYGEYVDGEGRKKAGIFPRNFVERYEPEAPPRPARSHRVRKSEPGTTEGQGNGDVPADPDAREAAFERPVVVSAAGEPASPVRDLEQQHRQQTGRDQDVAKPEATVPLSPKPSAPAPPASTAREGSGRSAVDEKPVPSSFKDRIAAFNKSSAPPPAPMKPTGLSAGGSSFVKKPFVAPPPSRDAYVPVPREVSRTVHRRDDEPEREGAPQPHAQPLPEAGPIPEPSARRPEDADISKGEPESKPTSLKERIALLQKQQLETARRHGESAQKREQPKKPAKTRPAPVEAADAQQGTTDDRDQGGATVSTGDRPAERPAPRPAGASTLPAPGDANDADRSGADEPTEDPEDISIEQDGVERRAKDATARLPHGSAARSGHAGAESGDAAQEDEGDGREEADEEEEEEEIDPELKRRMEIRDRMAKMSGGMGMHGILGIPGPLPRAAPVSQGARREKTQSDRRQDTPTLDSPHPVDAEARSQPTQILPVPLPPRESRPSPRPASPLSPSEPMLLSRDPPSQPETPGARQDGSASQDVDWQMPVQGADMVPQSSTLAPVETVDVRLLTVGKGRPSPASHPSPTPDLFRHRKRRKMHPSCRHPCHVSPVFIRAGRIRDGSDNDRQLERRLRLSLQGSCRQVPALNRTTRRPSTKTRTSPLEHRCRCRSMSRACQARDRRRHLHQGQRPRRQRSSAARWIVRASASTCPKFLRPPASTQTTTYRLPGSAWASQRLWLRQREDARRRRRRRRRRHRHHRRRPCPALSKVGSRRPTPDRPEFFSRPISS